MFDEVRIVMFRSDALSSCPSGCSYVSQIHDNTTLVFEQAIRGGVLEKNPCCAANLLKMVTREALLALNGVRPKVMQGLASHYSPQITTHSYVHVHMDAKREAVAAVSKAFVRLPEVPVRPALTWQGLATV